MDLYTICTTIESIVYVRECVVKFSLLVDFEFFSFFYFFSIRICELVESVSVSAGMSERIRIDR